MALIDLVRATDHAYGGIGFGIATPATSIEAKQSSGMSFQGGDHLPSPQQQKITLLLQALEKRYPGTATAFILRNCSPVHTGFGSCTALLLSIATAHVTLHGISAPPSELQALTGRGGTSGIGVNVFFCGGMVRDAGRPWEEVREVGPSSAARPNTIPKVLANLAFPDNWRIALLLPDGKQVADGLEQKFFAENIPSITETREVLETIDSILMPAIATSDFETFRPAVVKLGQIGFKAREISAQSPAVKGLLSDLFRQEALAVGMSSFGPALYAVWHKDQDGHGLLRSLATTHNARLINTNASPLGKGHVIYEQ